MDSIGSIWPPNRNTTASSTNPVAFQNPTAFKAEPDGYRIRIVGLPNKKRAFFHMGAL